MDVVCKASLTGSSSRCILAADNKHASGNVSNKCFLSPRTCFTNSLPSSWITLMSIQLSRDVHPAYLILLDCKWYMQHHCAFHPCRESISIRVHHASNLLFLPWHGITWIVRVLCVEMVTYAADDLSFMTLSTRKDQSMKSNSANKTITFLDSRSNWYIKGGVSSTSKSFNWLYCICWWFGLLHCGCDHYLLIRLTTLSSSGNCSSISLNADARAIADWDIHFAPSRSLSTL